MIKRLSRMTFIVGCATTTLATAANPAFPR